MKKEYIIPIFVPHLGCPNDCTFCNQKKISGQTKNVKAEDVKNTIEYYLNNFKDDNKYIEVAFFGGSFTGIDVDKQKELLSVAYEYIKNKKIDSIRISTRPDYINKEILKMLKSYGVKTIELGVQSTNDYILNKSKRGHTFEDVKKASKLIRKNGFILGHQMMVGLPESTKQYTPLTVEQAVETAKDLLVLFNKKKINVIRIGLQNTNEITDPNSKKSQVVAGPYHPAFRQLVESRLWYDNIANEIKKVNSNVTHIQIDVNPSDINNAVGHKRINIEKINDTYNTDLKINPNSKIKKGKLKITKLIKYQEFIKENVK